MVRKAAATILFISLIGVLTWASRPSPEKIRKNARQASWNVGRGGNFRGESHPQALRVTNGPQGALFQEATEPSSPLKDAWLVLGLYVVAGLVAGALCGYLAVGRGLSPLPWFFAGLLLNVVALGAVLLTRGSADLSRFPGGIPAGLTKVPTTRAPQRCSRCSADNHPAARVCLSCGSRLEPLVEAETDRT